MTISNVSSGDLITASKMNEVIGGVNNSLPLTGGYLTGEVKIDGTLLTPSHKQCLVSKDYVDNKKYPPFIQMLLGYKDERSLNTFYKNHETNIAFITFSIKNKSAGTEDLMVRYSPWDEQAFADEIAHFNVPSNQSAVYSFLLPKDHYYGVYVVNPNQWEITCWSEGNLTAA